MLGVEIKTISSPVSHNNTLFLIFFFPFLPIQVKRESVFSPNFVPCIQSGSGGNKHRTQNQIKNFGFFANKVRIFPPAAHRSFSNQDRGGPQYPFLRPGRFNSRAQKI